MGIKIDGSLLSHLLLGSPFSQLLLFLLSPAAPGSPLWALSKLILLIHSSKRAYSMSHPLGVRSLSSFYTLAGQENKPCPFMDRELSALFHSLRWSAFSHRFCCSRSAQETQGMCNGESRENIHWWQGTRLGLLTRGRLLLPLPMGQRGRCLLEELWT